MFRPLCLIALAAAATAALAPTEAQADDFVINVAPGAQSLPLAVPRPVSAGAGDLDEAVWKVLKRDLEITGTVKPKIITSAFVDICT